MRKKWLKRGPDRKKLRLRILSRESFEQILADKSPQPTLKGPYRRWLREEGFFAFETEDQAWKVAYDWLAELRGARRSVALKDSEGHRVYVFEMQPAVWDKKRFAACNDHLDSTHHPTCLYVGKTSKTPEERYLAHTTPGRKGSTAWGREFFIRPFEKAFRQDLLDRYEADGFTVEKMKESEAFAAEAHLSEWLRDNGYAAYFA